MKSLVVYRQLPSTLCRVTFFVTPDILFSEMNDHETAASQHGGGNCVVSYGPAGIWPAAR